MIVVQLFSRARILEKLQVTSKTVNVIIKKKEINTIFHDLYYKVANLHSYVVPTLFKRA